ncbi:MAG TPA: hypothetical protein VG963_31270, partial [Polyangiaceae bacterium]|nr:hypothetical protein [Polyangiaceae bacterium]
MGGLGGNPSAGRGRHSERSAAAWSGAAANAAGPARVMALRRVERCLEDAFRKTPTPAGTNVG